MPTDVKTCSHCKILKSFDEFHANGTKRDGRDHRCKVCMANVRKAWRKKNHEAVAQKAREYYLANRDHYLSLMAKRHRANPEDGTLRTRRWAENNPEGVAAKNARRKAAILSSPGTHTASEARDLLIKQAYRCANCEIDLRVARRHLDHFFPLARGGSNSVDNLQWLCQPCNNRKHAMDPLEWLAREGKVSLLNRNNHAS